MAGTRALVRDADFAFIWLWGIGQVVGGACCVIFASAWLAGRRPVCTALVRAADGRPPRSGAERGLEKAGREMVLLPTWCGSMLTCAHRTPSPRDGRYLDGVYEVRRVAEQVDAGPLLHTLHGGYEGLRETP